MNPCGREKKAKLPEKVANGDMESGRHLGVENRECRARERRNWGTKKVRSLAGWRLGKSKVSENRRLESHIIESHWVASSKDSIAYYC